MDHWQERRTASIARAPIRCITCSFMIFPAYTLRLPARPCRGGRSGEVLPGFLWQKSATRCLSWASSAGRDNANSSIVYGSPVSDSTAACFYIMSTNMHFTLDKVKSDERMEQADQQLRQRTGERVAENETLTVDGQTASRWTPLRERISSGQFSDCFADVEREFYLGLRRACRIMTKRGVPLDVLLTTAYERPSDLEELVRHTRYQDYANVLLDVVRSQA